MLFSINLQVLAIAFCQFSLVLSQTYTKCDPLEKSCPPNLALGKSVEVDLSKEIPDNWISSKEIKLGKDGGSFTIESDGTRAEIQSKFYIMFGKVEVTMKSSPGQGIVSAIVVQAESGDEIDFEWIGTDNMQAQSNYFAKRHPDHTRGQFHKDPNNQETFKTYTIDWDSERIIWKIDGKIVRLETAAESGGNYPQTPSYIKIGNWAGGHPGHPKGTIEWAGGLVDYSKAPFTMQVKSVKVADYSTGTQYEYADKTGNWKSIKAVNGQVNPRSPNGGEEAAPSKTNSTTSSVTSSQKSCGPTGSPDAECSNKPSTASTVVSTSATGTIPTSTPTAGTNSASSSLPKNTQTPSNAKMETGEAVTIRFQFQSALGAVCVLGGLLALI
ncbi:hypothetical protein AJ79_02663 [Helicocarpus griseus UAMH5409]|uniref:Crh-like protein n=1 Tax=Helicocarpus griseus UAMH5409 TaxID=1447875 RepID=A0A2B7Y1R0_9EURO|nr:hypothetical protein AJ79_02663 [Helicocarpus griseus UAMH5409]